MVRLEEEKKKHAANIVLIVDDDMGTRQSIRKSLSNMARMIEATDAGVLPAYQQFLPNLVLMDAQTALKNDSDKVKEILDYDPEAFIVILSTECTQQSILDSKNRGAKGFICKPFNRDILLKYASLAGMKARSSTPASKQASVDGGPKRDEETKDLSHVSA